MEFLIGIMVICTAIGIIGSLFGASPRGFQKMGDVTGMTLEDISNKVGPPTSSSVMEDGMLHQWIATSSIGGYHFAIAFDNAGRAVGYTHQHVS